MLTIFMQNNIPELAKLLRYYSLVSTTEAGSGHPTSSLSAADLMAALIFGRHGDAKDKALEELGVVDKSVVGEIALPGKIPNDKLQITNKYQLQNIQFTNYSVDKTVATRKAFGNSLNAIYPAFSNMVVLDAEVSNSTFTETFKKEHPERFFEMFIAEQNIWGSNWNGQAWEIGICFHVCGIFCQGV